MTKIYLIRHAEAEGNIYRRVQGWYDSLVTARGERQLGYLAGRFKDIPIDAAYASSYRRAYRTAGAVANVHGLKVNIDDELREVGCGAWEDHPWAEAELEYGPQVSYFNSSPDKWDIPDGEPYSVHSPRIIGAVRRIAERHDGQSVVIASHGAIIRAFLLEPAGLPPWEISKLPQIDNTAVSLVNYEDGKFSVGFIGDSSHIPEGESAFAHQTWWKNKGGLDNTSLWYTPVRFPEDEDTYLAFLNDAWQTAHGSLKRFPDNAVNTAAARAAKCERNVVFAMCGNERAGLIELDPDRGCSDGTGWISFYYMTPEYRGRSMAIQLLGHAVSVYRPMGRTKIRLMAAEENVRAVGFYEHIGFKTVSVEQGKSGRLLIMEKDISL